MLKLHWGLHGFSGLNTELYNYLLIVHVKITLTEFNKANKQK